MTAPRPSRPSSRRDPSARCHAACSAFRHRNFRLFWAGMLVSLIGTWMQSVAQAG